MSTPQQELVWRAIEAYNTRDAEAAVAISHPDVVWRPMAATAVDGSPYEGHEGVRRYFEDTAAIWEELRVEVDELRGDGDAVVLLGRIRARGRGSQADVESPAALLIEFRDGLIVLCDTYRTLDELPG